MECEQQQLAQPREAIVIGKRLGKSTGRFLAFLISGSILIAAFAISSLWVGGNGESLFEKLTSVFRKEPTGGITQPGDEDNSATSPQLPNEGNEEVVIPEGAVPILGKDLSAIDRGENYIQNETAYRPNVAELRGKEWQTLVPDMQKPLVLILHTHATEAYLDIDTNYLPSPVGDHVYSEDATKNVIAVGEALAATLNRSGIPTLHCKELHGDAGTLRNSYSHSAACVEEYLLKYPSIQYVIDLHRDSVLTAEGAYIRTQTETAAGERTAQVMAVVGSDGNGTQNKNWENNLALALLLRDGMNANGEALCRPVSLRNASYNQELASYGLLLEIGSGANTVEEAKRAAVRVGEVLASIIKGA